MDQVIARALDSIDKILESSPNGGSSKLVDTGNLKQLLDKNLPRKDWARLFCRQLKRLMDYNESLSEEFWIELHEYILYIIQGPDGERNKGNISNQFITRIEFERKLEERELQFEQNFQKRKSWSELRHEHKEFFDEYLEKCISFHSKVKVRGLFDNIDDFLCRACGVTDSSITTETLKYLDEKLKCIEINLDWSNRLLWACDPRLSDENKIFKTGNDGLNNFQPSVEIKMKGGYEFEKIANVFRCHRWLVILGDPGSAKTTLLRCITRIFAKAALDGDEDVVLEEDSRIPIRIPILIQIGAFTEWLNQHRTKTLIDYIGEHTWFSERYCHNDRKGVLKELIYHGHALILLDGLDEIAEVGRRSEIVTYVQKFIDEYVRAPDFISTIDDKMFSMRGQLGAKELIETLSPEKSGGNQIIITCRIVGYHFYALSSSFIQHYSLLLIDHNEAKKFAETWISQVETAVHDILLNAKIKIDEETRSKICMKRNSAMERTFENGSQLLMSNPSLLSLICTIIFQSIDTFYPKSRIEVYDRAVQAALRTWKRQESSISEDVLINFLIDLATYLHVKSSSAFIDAFDIKHLCCLTLTQQGIENDRMKLREVADKLISLLGYDIGIIAERGLQIFGFLHLPFQEYFVAQSLIRRYSFDPISRRRSLTDAISIRHYSIEDIANRFLSFTVNLRFRESLLFALGWISWKWSFDDYDKFVNFLISLTKDYAIPLGSLLFFDAINDLRKMPSNAVIFIALNTLLDHPSNEFKRRFFISNLVKFREDIIIEWMQSYLKNDKYLFKFCQSFPLQHERYSDEAQCVLKSIPSVVYRELWSFYKKSKSVEFVIDQTLRRMMILGDISDQIFYNDSFLRILLENICISSVHPMILSVIIAVSGGVCLKTEENIVKIHFSPKQMHRESSILAPIVEYFSNKEDSHSNKVTAVIKQYENVLKKSLPSDTSAHIVDTFIALICLRSVSHSLIYEEYNEYQALPLALERFKWIWFYLRQSCNCLPYSCYVQSDLLFINSEVKSIMEIFSSQSNRSIEQKISFSVACAAAWKKLGLWDFENECVCVDSPVNDGNQYLPFQSKFTHLAGKEKLNQLAENIRSLKRSPEKLFCLLTFLPQSLQQLYYCTIIIPTTSNNPLPLVVLLSQCLTYFENVDKNDLEPCLALPMLYPLLKKHMLENYALVLYHEKYSHHTDFFIQCCEQFFNAKKHHKLFDPFINQPEDYEILINMECQRLHELKNTAKNQDKDVRLFATVISLTRLFQALYRSGKQQAIKKISSSSITGAELYIATINIQDITLRIIAISIMLDMKDSLIFDGNQRYKLQWQMVFLLQSIVSKISLLTATLLFIRCHMARQLFPVSFKYMAKIIGEKLNATSISRQSQYKEAAFIALRQLNDADLSHYLLEFAKRTNNLSDLLHFNSTTFHHSFTDVISCDSLHTSTLLSSMYLVELAFDVQILKMYTEHEHTNNILPLEELRQLWNILPENQNIMTFKVATWITNRFQILRKKETHQIIKDMCLCSMIEKKALSVIKNWLKYRTDKDLKYFAYYAALQLVAEGDLNIPGLNTADLIGIIKEMFSIDRKFRLKSIVERLLSSQFVDLEILEKILVALHQNVHYSSEISVWVDCENILKLVLKLEQERVTSNVGRRPRISANPFFLMIKKCSEDLQIYLAEYICVFVKKLIKIKNSAEEEYLAIVIKWVIENSVNYETTENFSMELYKCVFELLHNEQFPRVQKAIFNALYSIFIDDNIPSDNVFMQNDAVINLEKMICSWKTYSEDVLAVCLLAYGSCLQKHRTYRMVQNISSEVKDILTTLFKTSSSEIIRIRANFCLFFMENANLESSKILNWFRNNLNITPENRYKILLENILYIMKSCQFITEYENEIIEHFEIYFEQLVGTFIINLYEYLCDIDDSNNNYLCDPSPNHVRFALEIHKKKHNEFRDAVQQSCCIKEFKNKLSILWKSNPRDGAALIELYCATFGLVAIDATDILERFKDDEIQWTPFCMKEFKEVCDREFIENLFQMLDSKTSYIQFLNCLNVLRYFGNDNISFLEVHQRIAPINVSYDVDDEWRNVDRDIFNLLLSFSSACNELLQTENKIFVTKSDIDEEFEAELKNLDERSGLFMRRNSFI